MTERRRTLATAVLFLILVVVTVSLVTWWASPSEPGVEGKGVWRLNPPKVRTVDVPPVAPADSLCYAFGPDPKWKVEVVGPYPVQMEARIDTLEARLNGLERLVLGVYDRIERMERMEGKAKQEGTR
uniref:Uncharacterized protein n=1 Tax=viral metagenome TaxID=1070528 RepID=A0A6M3LAC9_9ZZZZ